MILTSTITWWFLFPPYKSLEREVSIIFLCVCHMETRTFIGASFMSFCYYIGQECTRLYYYWYDYHRVILLLLCSIHIAYIISSNPHLGPIKWVLYVSVKKKNQGTGSPRDYITCQLNLYPEKAELGFELKSVQYQGPSSEPVVNGGCLVLWRLIILFDKLHVPTLKEWLKALIYPINFIPTCIKISSIPFAAFLLPF